MGAAGMTLADLSNIFIMIAALAVFFVMLLILLRNMAIVGVVGEAGEVLAWGAGGAAPRPHRLLMQRVHIPFTFKLTHTNATSYSEVRCVVSSTVAYSRVCWWGAPVRELHTALWLPLRDVVHAPSLAGHLSHTTPITRCGAHCEREVTLGAEASLSLGGPPRICYPLVVMLAREEADTVGLRPDDTVALVSVVHIRDSTCPLPSGVLAQYLKQANGQLSCLKQLYMSGEGVVETSAYEGAAPPAAAAEGALCCVCTARPLSRALLPCRHACLCASCFPKLDKCPICRSGISSYFCIRGEEEGGGGGGEVAGKRSARWPVSLHHRLLDLFPYH